MNSISLSSYSLKSRNYEELRQALTEKGFDVDESSSTSIIKDRTDDQYNYGLIFRRRVIVLDDRSINDPEFRMKTEELKDLLSRF